MKISENGLSFVRQFEGLRPAPYKDIRGIATIGYGSTYYLDGRHVEITDQKITPDMAEQLLEATLNNLGEQLDNLIEVDLNQNQIDALIDLAYNIGIGNFGKSTLLKLLNQGDFDGAGKQFLCWEFAGGHVSQGLIRRREQEKMLFSKIS